MSWWTTQSDSEDEPVRASEPDTDSDVTDSSSGDVSEEIAGARKQKQETETHLKRADRNLRNGRQNSKREQGKRDKQALQQQMKSKAMFVDVLVEERAPRRSAAGFPIPAQVAKLVHDKLHTAATYEAVQLAAVARDELEENRRKLEQAKQELRIAREATRQETLRAEEEKEMRLKAEKEVAQLKDDFAGIKLKSAKQDKRVKRFGKDRKYQVSQGVVIQDLGAKVERQDAKVEEHDQAIKTLAELPDKIQDIVGDAVRKKLVEAKEEMKEEVVTHVIEALPTANQIAGQHAYRILSKYVEPSLGKRVELNSIRPLLKLDPTHVPKDLRMTSKLVVALKAGQYPVIREKHSSRVYLDDHVLRAEYADQVAQGAVIKTPRKTGRPPITPPKR